MKEDYQYVRTKKQEFLEAVKQGYLKSIGGGDIDN